MDFQLTDVEARVLGALLEKEITTPEYYPLSLNALVNACNQKSNRDPFMTLDEETVKRALRRLDALDLAGAANTTDSRVTKYEHRLADAYNFTRQETAVLCVLLLRGPQTPGELRTRGERMYPFEDLNQVQSALQHLMSRNPALVTMLARQPGTKESRYAHLMSGPPADTAPPERPKDMPAAAPQSGDAQRITQLEDEIRGLKKELADLQRQFAEFRKQFE